MVVAGLSAVGGAKMYPLPQRARRRNNNRPPRRPTYSPLSLSLSFARAFHALAPAARRLEKKQR